MSVEYIVVQAGGKGTRMGHLTANRPKALVPVENLPMLFHLFREFPDKKYIIIGDYKYDVLERYLATFAEVSYQLVCGTGHTGTCAGMAEAMSLLPSGVPFLLIWSDLVLPHPFALPKGGGNYIGISQGICCRWKYENGFFQEKPSENAGVAGLFIFEDKKYLENVPAGGEFVRWLQEKGFTATELPLTATREFGLLSEHQKLTKQKCRPFNRIREEDGWIIKEAVDAQGKKLAKREQNWYQAVMGHGVWQIPRIKTLSPLKMEKIDGKNVYDYPDLSHEQKREILRQIIDCLKEIQALRQEPTDADSYWEAYIGKTYDRLAKVQKLVPFADRPEIVINARPCRNVLFHKAELEKMVSAYLPASFKLIHGDCTFSNIVLRHGETPILIDPRGYFGTTELCGDPAYDWAKLYYSIVGNYDQFNLKRFTLDINADSVALDIESNHWEDMEDEFFSILEDEVTREQIKLFHAIIWLSLTTYAWEDYDSICGAFYNGVSYFEDSLLNEVQ